MYSDLGSLYTVEAAAGGRGQAVVSDVAVGVPAATVDTVGVRGDVVPGGAVAVFVALPEDNDPRTQALETPADCGA